MTRPLLFALGLALISPVASSPAAPEDPVLKIAMGPSLEIGRRDLLFASISSVCEDEKGGFYVLDRMEFKVHRFSAAGRPIGTFGRKGQGPGDLQAPASIVNTSGGELAVLEDLSLVSFFDTEGVFRRRIDLNGRLGLGYVGPDRFYGWVWRPEDKQQVLVDGKNATLSTFDVQARDAFSVVLPDESGRAVMFNYASEYYVPEFLFDHNRALSAVGISHRYRIALLDESGREVGRIERDPRPRKLTGRERAYLEQGVLEFVKAKGWPPRVGRELGKKVPESKNAVRAVRISPSCVFVFGFPPDITRRDAPVPVDAFTRRGEFLGEAELPEVPLHVSDKAMYFVRTDADGNVYLVRTEYAMSAAR